MPFLFSALKLIAAGVLGGLIGFISIEIYHYINIHYPENQNPKKKTPEDMIF